MGPVRKKIAIAGLGKAARTIHLPAIARTGGLDVVGGYDPAVGDGAFPFPVFSSPEEMLRASRPDILVVATPPDSHFALARMGLEAGCHIFCEKPFMDSVEDAAAIVALAAAAQRLVVVNNQFRFMNIYREAKARIGAADFGRLLFMSASQTFVVNAETEAGWRGAERRRTCKDFGTHVFDLCRFFFDEDPIAVSARMPRGEHPEGPDFLNLVQLEFSGDRVAQVTLDRLSRGRHSYLDLRLDGTAGCIETHLGGTAEVAFGVRGGTRKPYVGVDVSPGGKAVLYKGDKGTKIASEPANVFAHATSRLLSAFLSALEQGTVPPCHAEDNRRTLALMLAAYESADTRQPIAMSY